MGLFVRKGLVRLGLLGGFGRVIRGNPRFNDYLPLKISISDGLRYDPFLFRHV